ncbi:Ppx/GppA phosphatase family protein [Dactylosporangium sp. NPDC048998]|uniref:Ppx/GppA phosphatase family protein n=1 Tax=Dactylosporangium sp. NPDC048998 TaxID=3363976 RepID=UPI0037241824
MLLAVLDVGSNSAHLQIVQASSRKPPQPVFRLKAPTLLAESVTPDGALTPDGIDRVVEAVACTVEALRRHPAADLIPLATATIRDATNNAEIRRRVREATGVELRSLSGEDEARVTFLAVRRWLAGPEGLLLLDIGGMSMEIAAGHDERPDLAVSLPLGAGLLTRRFLPEHPAGRDAVERVRRHVRAAVHPVAAELARRPRADRIFGTSKTFKQLARLTGEDDRLTRRALRRWVPRLAEMSPRQRAKLPGVAPARARQLLAGAVTAVTVMESLGLRSLDVCPWALREGLLLRRFTELRG